MKFTKTKNGYSEKEVDDYILSTELEYEKSIAAKEKEISELNDIVKSVQDKEKSIAIALTAAVDKAKEIETSSKNIYRLKIEQMTILCSRWEMLLNEMIKKYPGIEDISNVREDINNLKSIIKNSLKDDFNIDIISKNPVTDPIRVLLSRLSQTNTSALKEKQTKPVKKVQIERRVKVSANDKTELSKLEEKTNQIKPIVNLGLNKGDKYENLVDKFLNSEEEDTTNSATPSVFKIHSLGINEEKNRFDLNEAVNPTEDLDEIMKAFDFYKKNKN